jgi:two-component system, sensor histidine kinase and response regulator
LLQRRWQLARIAGSQSFRRSEASQDWKGSLASLAKNGHKHVALIEPALSSIQATMSPAPWEHGEHMEALANLAHELRSPVQAFLGYLDILREELSGTLSDRHRRVIERLNANAHDLAQTVENVMDFSVSDAMAEAPHEEEVCLHDLIAELAPVLDATNDSKCLKITFDLERAPAVFRSRLRPIKSILLNLAVNAVRFTDHGGVNIAIRLTQFQSGSAIELEVRDTGPGITAEQVAEAFQPCVQLSRSSVRKFRGMGLGLAVVQRNAQALGAEILVKPILPHGTAFSVIIPIAYSAAEVLHPIHA